MILVQPKISCITIADLENEDLIISACITSSIEEVIDEQQLRIAALNNLKEEQFEAKDVVKIVERNEYERMTIPFYSPTEQNVLTKGLKVPQFKMSTIYMYAKK